MLSPKMLKQKQVLSFITVDSYCNWAMNHRCQLTDNKIVHTNIALARHFLVLKVLIGELMNRKVLNQAYSFCYFDLFIFGQLATVMTHARRWVKYRLNVLLKKSVNV